MQNTELWHLPSIEYPVLVARASAWPIVHSQVIDKGRSDVTDNPADLYVFNVAVLRYVAVPPHHFHDGLVATLPEAVRLTGKVRQESETRGVKRQTAWSGGVP
jgi:cytochrome c peroxidase